jgi:hypothetical protein
MSLESVALCMWGSFTARAAWEWDQGSGIEYL